ncbi:MAG: MATE family efflux transporter [Clostridia bacterium]|nr:MATE family efflux transporter [Clostridia bacterium]
MNIALSEHFGYRKLIKFTLPTIIMMIFTSIYGVVDGLFISNCVGSTTFAAVNLVWPVIMVLSTFGFMIGTGGSALVSKTLGENKPQKASEIFSMLIYLLIAAGIVLIVLGLAVIKPVVILLGADEEMLAPCIIYGSILLIAIPTFLLQTAFQSFLVVAEKPQLGLGVSVAAGVTNMVLDFLFVYALQGGVVGAALATALSRLVGAVIPLIYFICAKSAPIRLVKAKFDLRAILSSCANGSSEMVSNLSMSIVNMLYNLQLMKFAGSNGVVAYGIIMYAGFLFVGTYQGYAVGSAPIVSYHYGARHKEELHVLLRKSLTLIAIISVVMTLLAELSAPLLATIFVSYDENLMQLTTTAIRLFMLSYLLSGINIFTSSFFTALNNGAVSALISFLRTFVFQLAAILIIPAFFGLNGIWLSVLAAEAPSLVVSIICLIANKKKYGY